MYTLKKGVMLFMTPEIQRILECVCTVFKSFDLPVVITSGLDGPHRDESLHYKGRAIDIRNMFKSGVYRSVWDIHSKSILENLYSIITDHQYPVRLVVEDDHLHFEWYGP